MTATKDPYKGLKKRWQAEKDLRREAARKKRFMAADLASVFKRYGVHTVYIFGSVARGKCSPRSDIDLYVEDVRPEDFWALWRDLESRADQPIDLHCQLDDFVFVSKIKERGELIYEG